MTSQIRQAKSTLLLAININNGLQSTLEESRVDLPQSGVPSTIAHVRLVLRGISRTAPFREFANHQVNNQEISQ